MYDNRQDETQNVQGFKLRRKGPLLWLPDWDYNERACHASLGLSKRAQENTKASCQKLDKFRQKEAQKAEVE